MGLLFSLFVLFILRFSTPAVITTAPVSELCMLYTSRNYTCVGTGSTLFWTVEGHSLTIRALPINDGISIGCNVLDENFDYDIKGATLIIQGITQVSDLDLTFNVTNSSSLLTWSYPFENYPISYHINIENQHGQLRYNDITEDTSYELYNLTVCDIYTATVIVHSGEYCSEKANVQKVFTEEIYSIDLSKYDVIFDEHSTTSVHFNVNVTGYPRLCNSTLLGITRNDSQHIGTEHSQKDIICSIEDKESIFVNYTVSNLGPQLNYTFTADILDQLNRSKAQRQSHFITYHVQGLTLQNYSDNGSFVVECRFAERSAADGCHVIFRESSKGIVKFTNITKSSIEESTVYQYITLPVSGNYTVTAHDIVDGIITTNPSVVYPKVLEYILLLPSPTEIIIITNFISIDETLSLISNITSPSSTTAFPEPTSGLSNVLYVIIPAVVLVIIGTVVIYGIVFSCARKSRKKPSMIPNKDLDGERHDLPNSNNNSRESTSMEPMAQNQDGGRHDLPNGNNNSRESTSMEPMAQNQDGGRHDLPNGNNKESTSMREYNIEPSQIAITSCLDSAISSASGYNNGLEIKSEDSIPLSANNEQSSHKISPLDVNDKGSAQNDTADNDDFVYISLTTLNDNECSVGFVGNKLPNQVINENGDHSTRVFNNTKSSYQEEMSNSQLHMFDSSPEIMSHPSHHLFLECIIEDEPESEKNHVVDLSLSELVYITQKLNVTNDTITCSNVQGVIQVNDDNDNSTCDLIVNKSKEFEYGKLQETQRLPLNDDALVGITCSRWNFPLWMTFLLSVITLTTNDSLIESVKNGDLSGVKYPLSRGVIVNATDLVLISFIIRDNICCINEAEQSVITLPRVTRTLPRRIRLLLTWTTLPIGGFYIADIDNDTTNGIGPFLSGDRQHSAQECFASYLSFMGKAKTFVNQETSKDLHKKDWMYIYDNGGWCQRYDLLVRGGVKVREKIVGGSKIGRKKLVIVAHYDKTKVFKKKIDLHLKNAQLLCTLHEFHENFILVEKSCAFKYGTFLSLICDQMSSSYFIADVLPYCQLIDRYKPVFDKSCDPVMIVFKSNTVPQEHIHDNVLFWGFALKDEAGQYIAQYQVDKDTLPFIMTDDNEVFKGYDSMAALVDLSDDPLGDNHCQIEPAFTDMFIQWINEENESALIEALKVMKENYLTNEN